MSQKPLLPNQSRYAEQCIYTIRHTDIIDQFSRSEGPHYIDTKRKRWTTAKRMIAEARKQGKIVPLLFAPAENTANVVAWAELRSVETGQTNRCTFEKLKYCYAPIKKAKLKRLNGENLSRDFIRDYAICRTPPTLLFSNQLVTASGVIRSPSTASEIVQHFAPKEHLVDVLKAVAHSIQVADQASSSKWGTRLNRDSIMLKVGFVEVLQFGEGWFHLLIRGDLVPAKLRTNERLDFSNAPYRNAPGCDTCTMDVTTFARTYSTLLPAHEAAIHIAARSRIHTSTAKDHSPELIVFLSRELGTRLPQPAYLNPPTEDESHIPEEISRDEDFTEGAVIQVLVNRYERDQAARERCIKHYGAKCVACGVSLADRYGPEVNGLIHVHHLTPLASVGVESSVDPICDLRPVCPNCHAVIHSTKPPRTVEEVQEMILVGKSARSV
jgi:hypothetical protein